MYAKRSATLAILALLSACNTSSGLNKPGPMVPNQPVLSIPQGAQSVNIATSPEKVRATLVASAKEKGTRVLQDQPNMIVMERILTGANPALDTEFGPSKNGLRVIRIRVRFTGTPCNTLAVQDLAVVNNVHTNFEQTFVLPGNSNTQASLNGLKQKAEQGSTCRA